MIANLPHYPHTVGRPDARSRYLTAALANLGTREGPLLREMRRQAEDEQRRTTTEETP